MKPKIPNPRPWREDLSSEELEAVELAQRLDDEALGRHSFDRFGNPLERHQPVARRQDFPAHSCRRILGRKFLKN